MSFVERADDVIEKAEASLVSLISDATRVKAYGDIITIAAMAQSLAAVPRREGKRPSVPEFASGVSTAHAEPVAVAASAPTWMRR
jgi:hypothetical protein